MKNIVAIIRRDKYFATKKAIIAAGFPAFNSKLVYGRGKKSVAYTINIDSNPENTIAEYPLLAKTKLEIFARDEDVDQIINIIMNENHTNNPGDGKIFVLPVKSAIRIRTNEKDENALV